MSSNYDVIIIGSGPAGMSAALYTSRANLTTLMIEKECPGGKMMKTKIIENYLGSSSTNAMELASNMFTQAIKFGAKYKQGNVVKIDSNSDYKTVTLSNGEAISCKALILAIGGKIDNVDFRYDKYLNRGLSYCVVCDASLYKGKDVCVIGDNKAVDDVSYLANIANKVYFINSEGESSNRENVITFANTNNYELGGNDAIEYLAVNAEKHPISGAFYVSDSNSFNGFNNLLELEKGYIKVDTNMHTNIDGVYACGDIVNKSIKQVSSAVGDGALAALETIKYVNKTR